MKIIKLSGPSEQCEPCVATIGFFDGVHRGHRYLLSHITRDAKANGLASTAVTFDVHPRKVLQTDYQPQLLTTIDEKLLLLSKTGVDNCALLHFDKAMSEMTATDFMRDILAERLNVKKLYIGYDHHFGHDTGATFEDYCRYGRQLGIEVMRSPAFTINGSNISSSLIRKYLLDGEIELANNGLGYPYTILGKVVSGYRIGHRIGFPTANIDMSGQDKIMPAPGVYAVKARLSDSVVFMHGMMNIGTRPTFDGTSLTIEVNLFNFNGDLYGRDLLISFIHRIRQERKFSSAGELSEQLKKDKILVEQQFAKDIELES